MIELRTVIASRYVTPLREGGSLPAIIEADDDGLYVLKFRGAGQGPKALIAELLAGEIGRMAGLPVPEIVLLLFAALRYAPVMAVPLAYVNGVRVWVTPPLVAVPHDVNGTAAVLAK